MGDLAYATVVILIIWAGVFFYLTVLARRLKRLEQLVEGGGRPAADTGAGASPAATASEEPPAVTDPDERGGSEGAGASPAARGGTDSADEDADRGGAA
jgi:CcmD family protein